MPEITISGGLGNNPVIATCTQSVGVPSTLIISFSKYLTRNGTVNVKELLAPLRLRSGATT